MRIKKLWIEEFKNLRNFEITFGNYLTTVFIGRNGTGKSNLLEAIAIIFRDLDLELRNKDALQFEYLIEYECRGKYIVVDANPSQTQKKKVEQLTLNGKLTATRRTARLSISVNGNHKSMKHFFGNKGEYLPNHVFGYYSGPTNRLAQHFSYHQEKFDREQREGEERPLRPLFFALPVHSQFVLLAYFIYSEPGDSEFLENFIGVDHLESVRFVIQKPDWAKLKSSQDPFWGAIGLPREFLEKIFRVAQAPARDNVDGPNEKLYLHITNISDLEEIAFIEGEKTYRKREFFKDLDSLYISRLISEVRISVRKVGTDDILTFSELSEGEQQLLVVLGLLKFTSDRETLFLLDEPDTHLNPIWKLDYLRLIEPIVGDDTKCQLLLATHDPIVVGGCLKEQVRVLDFESGERSGNIYWRKPNEDPRGMGVAALLTSDVFGLRSQLDLKTLQDLDRKRELDQKDELSPDEKEELKQLTEQLVGLDFTKTARDPLYEPFVEAMTQALEEEQLNLPVLTPEQQERQRQLAFETIKNLKAKQGNE